MKKCIICKKIKNDEEFNNEHIIPESIGGSLTIDNVCKECNTKLGDEIDSKIINDFLICLGLLNGNLKDENGSNKIFGLFRR